MTLQQRTAAGARMGIWYVRGMSGFLLLQGLAGAVLKIAGSNQADLAHNFLHIASGMLGLWACKNSTNTAAFFARWFGAGYLGLALVGWLSPEGLIGSTLQLQLADQAFHTLVGATSLAVGIRSGTVKERNAYRRTT